MRVDGLVTHKAQMQLRFRACGLSADASDADTPDQVVDMHRPTPALILPD